MKKMVSIICALAVLSCVSFVSAGEIEIGDETFKDWYAQVDAGYTYPSNGTLDHDNATTFGFRLGTMYDENWSFEGQYQYTQYDLSNSDEFGETAVVGSKIRTSMFLLNAKYGIMVFTTNEMFYPYVLAGVGYSLNTWEPVLDSKGGVVATSEFDMDNSRLVQAGLGVDYYPAKDFAINFEMKKVWNDPSAYIVEEKKGETHTSSDDLDLGLISLSIGFRMLF